jgi:predicted DNA-binding antitoxin AbrB/MazE fold protein
VGKKKRDSRKGSKKRFLSVKINLILVINRGIKVKARYENEMLKPFGKLDLKEGEDVEIEVKKATVEELRITNHPNEESKWTMIQRED